MNDQEVDHLDYKDLTLQLDPKLIFEAPPHHFEAVVFVKRQHELLDAAIHSWIRRTRECRADSPQELQGQLALLAQGAARSADGTVLEVRGNNWTHQQRLMQALYSIGPYLLTCPPETLPVLLQYLGLMVLDPVQDGCLVIEKIIKTAKLYCRQAIKLYENALQKYHSTPGKQGQDGARESQVAHSVFDTKKEKCKAIYALSGTLNHAIAYKESFILEKTDIFLNTLRSWLSSGTTDTDSLIAAFSAPRQETQYFNAAKFPPVEFPLEEFKTHFARFCHSLMLPVSYRDLESLDPIVHTPGQKAGYLFHRNRHGEWTRQYFYIMPKGMLMQFAKGKDIQIANLNQTLLRTVNVDSRDFVFEICSIEIYLMESILQASTKVEYEEWKAALFHWHPPDDDIPQIDTLRVSTPPTKHLFARPRHISIGRVSDGALSSPKPRMSSEFPIVKQGELFVLDLRTKPMHAQSKVWTWKKITCCIRSNGHFAQYNAGEGDKPFETIPLAETLRTHIWALDGSLFSKKHCFSIKAPHDVNYYTISLKRSNKDQETFNSWLYTLKSFAKAEVFGANELLEYRLYRTFWIMVNDGRRLPKDLEAYCEIMLDDQRRARTSTRTKLAKGAEPDTPFWRDSFEFTDLAAFNKGITINVIQVKGSKLIPFGRTHIPVRNSEECDEGWYPILHINDRTRSTEHLGDLRLKLKYEEQIVLPLDNYSGLVDILVDFQRNNVINKLAELMTDLEGFSRNVLRILEGKGMAVVWLNSLIDAEIAEASAARVNTLFRGNTLLTKALDAYMRLVGTEYLDDTLGDILRNICKNKVACEVDPSKLERQDDLKNQWRTLMHHSRTCWRAVTDSVGYFPKELLLVFSHLQRRLTEKFPENGSSVELNMDADMVSLAKYTGVSGFVFLRLICPAILSPKLFHIVREHPEPRAHRTLTLIAKSLQGLANLVSFGAKESWMVPMNEFISENTKSLKDFIDQICLAESSSGVGSSSNSVRSLPMQPHSPGSTSSSLFRSQGRNASQPMMAMPIPLPSPGSQPRSSPRPFAKDSYAGTESIMSLDHQQDLPLLPHLIDLGKELAHFSTSVARVVPPWPAVFRGEAMQEKGPFGDENGDREFEADQQPNGDHDQEDGGRSGEEGEEDENREVDILQKIGRVCWDLIETIQERVELSVEMEQEERLLAANGGGSGMYANMAKSKISREGSRDGEESYVVFEHYDGHEHESFDGYGRGYDSDDESFDHPPRYE